MAKLARVPIDVRTITAGKFRRYMDIALWKQVIRPDIGGRNLVDMFRTAGGVAQSLRLLRKEKPDVVFAKGGYVSLPVGYAAHMLHIPLVIHDSDVRPGLTNRVLSRWAVKIATGTPVKNYRFNADRAQYTGVPIGAEFHVFTDDERRQAKQAYGIDENRPLIVVTGGGLGAKDINQAIVRAAPKLLERGYTVYHVTGTGPYEQVRADSIHDAHYHLVPFVYENLAKLYGAADVIVTRASATALQEIAAAARPLIVVPNSSLGDQLENAKGYEEAGAVVLLRDEALQASPEALYDAIDELMQDVHKREKLAERLHAFAKLDAAAEVAQLIFDARRG